jgi:hypothetical protein
MDLPGVRFDLAAQAAFVREALQQHLAAFVVPPPFWLEKPVSGAIPSLRHPGPVGPSSFWLRRP